MKFTVPNTLYTQDNLFVLYGMNSELADLIYLDPPFNSKRMYSAPVGSRAAGSAFKDMWTWDDVSDTHLEVLIKNHPTLGRLILSIQTIHGKTMAAYIAYMAQRLIECHRILKPTGSLYLHCDPTASHYLKLLCDSIFCKNALRNEIIWNYKKWAVAEKGFSRNHDIILFYNKNPEQSQFNVQLQARAASTLKRFGDKKIVSGFAAGGKRAPSQTLDETSSGVKMSDVWDIPIIAPSAKERTGYPTQKPLALMHRILQASSNEGDLVLDPFCGCATTCVAAQQLGRRWIGIDIEAQASKILIDRLSDDAGMFKNFVHRTDIPQRTDIEMIEVTASVKTQLFKVQKGECNGCGTHFEIRHFEIDHIVPKSKGGGDYLENLQLLCGSCNRIKGDRPMVYLMNRLNVIERAHQKISFGE